jgi:hypothetical protein
MNRERNYFNQVFRSILTLSFTVFAFATVSCSSAPTRSTKAPDTHVSQYRTYKWIGQTEADQLRLQNPPIDFMAGSVKITRRPTIEDKIRSKTEESLKKKGYRPSESEPPDFFVTFYGKAKNEDWISSWEGFTQSAYGVPIVISPNFDRELSRKYQEGVAYLTFYDAKTTKPTWTGTISSSEFGPKFGDVKVASAIDNLITEFSGTS